MTTQFIDGPGAQPAVAAPPEYSWERTVDGTRYKLSTDKSLLDISLFNKAFATEDVYWTGPMPDAAVKTMVDHSCVLGLYKLKPLRLEANRNIKSTSSTTYIPEQIGFGRIITDYATVAYITDVWIEPKEQGSGLGKWMVKGMEEIIHGMPALRRALLLTKVGGKGEQFYAREMGMVGADSKRDPFGFMQYVPEKR